MKWAEIMTYNNKSNQLGFGWSSISFIVCCSIFLQQMVMLLVHPCLGRNKNVGQLKSDDKSKTAFHLLSYTLNSLQLHLQELFGCGSWAPLLWSQQTFRYAPRHCVTQLCHFTAVVPKLLYSAITPLTAYCGISIKEEIVICRHNCIILLQYIRLSKGHWTKTFQELFL